MVKLFETSKALLLVLILVVLLFNNKTILAQSGSFELFWPLSAGKTIEEPFYFLKDVKEKVRGFLVFGSSQKSEYEVMLTTKRILETEKLIKEEKNDYVAKTLDKALTTMKSASDNWQKAKQSNNISQSSRKSISDRLLNLEIFLPSLEGKLDENVKAKLTGLQKKVKEFKNNL